MWIISASPIYRLPVNNQHFPWFFFTLNNIPDHMLHHQKLYSSSIFQSSASFFWKALRWWCGSREGNGRVRGHAGLSERSVADRREHVWVADAPAGANASLSNVHVLPELLNAHRNTEHCLFPEEPFRECEAKFSHWVTSIIATFYSVLWDRMDL